MVGLILSRWSDGIMRDATGVGLTQWSLLPPILAVLAFALVMAFRLRRK